MSLLARAASISPFGPIFGKELRVTSRRKRTYLLRVGYLALLLLALLLAFSTTGRSYGGVAARMQRQAELGMAFFIAFTIFSVGSMGLIGPVLTANAIGAEKLAKTLPVLLMTPITAWQVVSGKLFSRVLVAMMLMGLSLPVLALCRLLGGVELTQMLAVLSLAVSIVISTAAIGLFLSLFLNRAAVVILLSYGILGVLYILVPVVLVALFDIGDGGPRGSMDGIKFLCAINPFMMAAFISAPIPRGILGDVWIYSVLVQLGFAGALLSLTAALLRRQFRNAGEKAIAVPPAVEFPLPPYPAIPYPATSLPLPPADEASASQVFDPPQAVQPGPPPLPPSELNYAPPSLRVPPANKIRDVGDNPVLWRELRRPLLPKLWQRIVGIGAVVIIMLLIYAVLADDNDLDDIGVQGAFACVFFGVWWLLSAVLSATAISQEKETDTWTLLLATPMNGRQIVWGKVVGLLRRLLWPTVLIAVHFLLFVIGGVIPFWSMLFVVLMTVACNSVWIATGMWISLKIKRVTFAVIANILLAVLVYGIVPLMVLIPAELLSRSRGDEVAEHTGWYIPYMYLAQGFEGIQRSDRRSGYYDYDYRYSSSGYRSYYSQSPYWLPGNERVDAPTYLAIASMCAILHLLLAYLILHRTGSNFDEIVGRAGRRHFVGIGDSDEAVLPVDDVNAPPGVAADPHTVDRDAQWSANASTTTGELSSASSAIYASLPRRLVAGAIDIGIVQFVCSVVGLAWGLIYVLTEELDEFSERAANKAMLNHWLASLMVGLVVGLIYAAVCESSRRRATPGKMLMGIFVTDVQGKRISFARAAGRHLAKILSILPLGLGYLAALASRRRQAIHDEMSGTVVLRK